MAQRRRCEFQLIRYVPDPVRNEFVNIGVLLRAAEGGQSMVRFTRDWGRVRCLDPDADTQMLEALEIEVAQRLQVSTGRSSGGPSLRCWKNRCPMVCRSPRAKRTWRRRFSPAWKT
jgi:hypothetical protein